MFFSIYNTFKSYVDFYTTITAFWEAHTAEQCEVTMNKPVLIRPLGLSSPSPPLCCAAGDRWLPCAPHPTHRQSAPGLTAKQL